MNSTIEENNISMKDNKGKQDKQGLNGCLCLFLVFIIFQHLGRIVERIIMLTTPPIQFYNDNKNVVIYSLALSIAMVIVIIGTMCKKKWGVIGFFCLQLANLIGIDALLKGQEFGTTLLVTCIICILFALLLLLRYNGKSAWKVIFESKGSNSKNKIPFSLKNVHWFKKHDEKISNNDGNLIERHVSEGTSLLEGDTVPPSKDKNITPKGNHKRFIKIVWIVLSAVVVTLIGLGSYLLYSHYTDNEYLMNKANETFKKGDIKKALEMYEKLADKNDYVPAKSRLADLYLVNDSVPLDTVKGVKYLTEASVTDSIALNHLITLYLGYTCKGEKISNTEKAKYYAELAIKKGIILGDAYFALGNYFSDKEDYASAYYYWEKSSEYNCTTALDNLGWMNYNGIGCDVNMNKAHRYFKRVLEEDSEDSYALYYMGLFYLNGYAVEQDKWKARDYFKKAADLGNEDAKAEYSKIQWDNPLSDLNL